MTTKTSRKPNHIPRYGIPETPEELTTRLSHEAAVIAQAEAEIAAGLVIDGDDLDAWLDQLDIDPDAPMPQPRPRAIKL